MMDLSNSSWMTTRGRFKHVSYEEKKSKLMKSLRTSSHTRLNHLYVLGASVTSTNIHGVLSSIQTLLPKPQAGETKAYQKFTH